MVEAPSASGRPRALAGLLSAAMPGAGHLLVHRSGTGVAAFTVTLILLFGAYLSYLGWGLSAAIFYLTLVVLPWWTFQVYDAYRPADQEGAGFRLTLRTIWREGHDIRYLGGLFLLSAALDFYIIVANPSYSLTVFCTKPGGILGLLAKAQSPTFHSLIGYGFLRLRRWALLLYLVYAAYGFANGIANHACFGYGRIRTVFLLTLGGFTAYILWRRGCFQPGRSL